MTDMPWRCTVSFKIQVQCSIFHAPIYKSFLHKQPWDVWFICNWMSYRYICSFQKSRKVDLHDRFDLDMWRQARHNTTWDNISNCQCVQYSLTPRTPMRRVYFGYDIWEISRLNWVSENQQPRTCEHFTATTIYRYMYNADRGRKKGRWA